MEKNDSYLYDSEKSDKVEEINKQDFQSITKQDCDSTDSANTFIKASYLVY